MNPELQHRLDRAFGAWERGETTDLRGVRDLLRDAKGSASTTDAVTMPWATDHGVWSSSDDVASASAAERTPPAPVASTSAEAPAADPSALGKRKVPSQPGSPVQPPSPPRKLASRSRKRGRATSTHPTYAATKAELGGGSSSSSSSSSGGTASSPGPKSKASRKRGQASTNSNGARPQRMAELMSGYPAHQRVELDQMSPYGSGRRTHRYNGYKTANTLGEALALGATMSDLQRDFEMGVLELVLQDSTLVTVRRRHKDTAGTASTTTVAGSARQLLAGLELDRAVQTFNGLDPQVWYLPELQPVNAEDAASSSRRWRSSGGSDSSTHSTDDSNASNALPNVNWVCCERCGKWRVIPNLPPGALPEQWYCELNHWDADRATCAAPEQSKEWLGVSWDQTNAAWAAHVPPTDDQSAVTNAALFATPDQAARAYDQMAGPLALRTNRPWPQEGELMAADGSAAVETPVSSTAAATVTSLTAQAETASTGTGTGAIAQTNTPEAATTATAAPLALEGGTATVTAQAEATAAATTNLKAEAAAAAAAKAAAEADLAAAASAAAGGGKVGAAAGREAVRRVRALAARYPLVSTSILDEDTGELRYVCGYDIRWDHADGELVVLTQLAHEPFPTPRDHPTVEQYFAGSAVNEADIDAMVQAAGRVRAVSADVRVRLHQRQREAHAAHRAAAPVPAAPAPRHHRTVPEDLKRIYVSQNSARDPARRFALGASDAQALLRMAHREVLEDWDGLLKRRHKGFASYSNTVGNHTGDEQRNHTRTVGPSADNWAKFEERYSWFPPLLELVKDRMRALLEVDELAVELWDMHILRQTSVGGSIGGAVFGDHQDRHSEQNGKTLAWTVTLLVGSSGPSTGFYQWGNDHGVLAYDGPGSAVLFESLAWHRSVIPAKPLWPFEALKFSFFFAPPSTRSVRYRRYQSQRRNAAAATADGTGSQDEEAAE